MDRTGRCVNFGNCTTANQKQMITMPRGLDLKCPECGRDLVEVTASAAPSRGPLVVFALALVLVALAGWWFLARRAPGTGGSGSSTTTSSGAAGAPPVANAYLRLHGSNTIGEQLAPALAEAFLKSQGASDVKVIRDTPEMIRVSGDGKTIAIEARGSSTAFTDLAAGKCDIGMASRPVKTAESTQATGDLTQPASEHVVGLDGVAVIVNRNNPVESLSREELSKIFAGVTTNWADIKGNSGPIKIYARDAKSGTYDTFRSLVLGARDLVGSAERFEDSTQLADKVAADPSGIGFVGLPYVGSTKALAVSDRGSRALTPNRLTVATEDYILSRRLFLYNSSTPSSAVVNQFVQFALGKDGQDVVEKIGFVSQHVRAEKASTAATPAAMAPDAPAEYKKLVDGAERLSVDYRFRPGSSALDNKAVVDLDRLITFLGDLHYAGKDLMLLGFADSTGDPAVNQRLSKERATAVADQIERRGVTPGTVTGFGPALPVADNGVEDGRQRNRRVEVWVKRK